MKRIFPAMVFALSFFCLFLFAGSTLCRDYIVMCTPNVNIRTGPGTDHFIIGRAKKGDIFKLVGEVDD